jgi:hypothetical protein
MEKDNRPDESDRETISTEFADYTDSIILTPRRQAAKELFYRDRQDRQDIQDNKQGSH